MSRIFTAVLAAVIAVMGISFQLSYAGEIDMLLQKLVEKGILTAGEAQQIGTETKEQVRKEIAAGKYSTLPSWIQTMKLKGDFRLRFQSDHAKKLAPGTAKTNDRERARIRLRLGTEAKVNEKLMVGVGLATGTDDAAAITNDTARSTNQSLGNGFSKHPITLDYAYAQYAATPWATLIGGKFKNPLWEPGDLIWDTDINPEGGAVKLVKNLGASTELFLTPAVLVIDESSSDASDPMAYLLQGGATQSLTDTIKVKAGVTYYNFTNVKGNTLDGTVSTNSVNGTALKYGYQLLTPAVELSIADPLKKLGIDLPYLAFFGEYVRNMDSQVKHGKSGFMIGAKFGQEKIEKWGDWQVRYNYAMLGKDAVLDTLPDSDRYGGKTGIRSHEAMFDWGLGKNTWLGLDYYYGWQLPGSFASTQTKPAQVFQVDWNMKF